MVSREITEQYAGARVTRLVNRTAILARIEDAIQDPEGGTYLFYIEAPGGTGKTFLAREVLRRSRERTWTIPSLLAASNEIDLYHHQARSREGFMHTFVGVLGEENGVFAPYQKQREHLQDVKYDLRGAINELTQQQNILTNLFYAGCEALAREKRTVVVLDTIEKMVYETDRAQQALKLSEDKVSVRPWLLQEWLPRIRNAVILICGRPRKQFAHDLETALQACSDIQYEHVTLGDFDLDDTLAYFQAVEDTAREEKNNEALKRLNAISDESRQVIHMLTNGHPITLALVIDYYLANGRLLPEAKMPLAELGQLSETDLAEVRRRVNSDIVRQYREVVRPADDVIVALAWTPKGMDVDLLTRVAGLKQEEAERILATLADPRTGLSFIKMRPADQRAFLHDEMYALMREHVLEAISEAEQERVYGEIVAYYAAEIKRQQDRVKQLQAEFRDVATPQGRVILAAGSGIPADPQALAAALAKLGDLQVEQVYYLLRADPLAGFALYCEYAEAAVTSNNDTLDMQLRDEMLSFVTDVFGEEKVFKGLPRDSVERDSALRWGWRNVYAANPKEADRIVRYLREKEPAFLGGGGALAWSELEIIEGWAAAFLGENLRETEVQLGEAIQTLLNMTPSSEFEDLRRRVLLAQGNNVMGYLLRVQGRFQAACTYYSRALPYWRDLKREADQAETLNNLAWASAEAGHFERALRHCRSGLKLRESLGHRYLIALSYNTLGLIEIRNDQPHRGRVHCERALGIFRDLGTPRGVGLACMGLAETHRRCTELLDVYLIAEQVEQLQLAARFATQAVEIFREQVPEQMRLVEALLELGCVYRNWARLRPDYQGDEDPGPSELSELGVEALQEAARIASDEFPYRQVDAQVNLAWLYFYIGRSQAALDILDEVMARLQPYSFSEAGRPIVQDPITFFWVQLGKAYLLRGQIAAVEYKHKTGKKGSVRDPVLWHQVAESFTLSLAYNELFSDVSRDMKRAKDTMYRTLEGMNIQELRALYEGVEITAHTYKLGFDRGGNGRRAQPRMLNFLEENFPLEGFDGGLGCV